MKPALITRGNAVVRDAAGTPKQDLLLFEGLEL